jgi:ATP-dependent Clp protease, protease subunit
MDDDRIIYPPLPKYTENYSNLAKDRIIFLTEEITIETASTLSALLLYYDGESEVEDITIYINTNGGDGSALANIYDIMQIINAPIKTICIGKAYSAGAFLLAAGMKGKRFITKNSTVMIHGMQCEFPVQNNDQINSKIYYEFLSSFDKNILRILAKHTGKSYKQIYDDCKIDRFLNAQETVEYGICDGII